MRTPTRLTSSAASFLLDVECEGTAVERVTVKSLALAAATCISLSACGADDTTVDADMTINQQDLQKPWPLTVESLQVVCGTNRRAVFGEKDGRAYALNGSAISNQGAYPGRYAVSDLKSIQKRDPDMAQYGNVMLDAGPVVEIAIQRCKQRGLNDV